MSYLHMGSLLLACPGEETQKKEEKGWKGGNEIKESLSPAQDG